MIYSLISGVNLSGNTDLLIVLIRITTIKWSYDISNEKTRKREIKGCIAGAKATKCDNHFLITGNESEVIEEDGYTIQVIPIWEWLTREA